MTNFINKIIIDFIIFMLRKRHVLGFVIITFILFAIAIDILHRYIFCNGLLTIILGIILIVYFFCGESWTQLLLLYIRSKYTINWKFSKGPLKQGNYSYDIYTG